MPCYSQTRHRHTSKHDSANGIDRHHSQRFNSIMTVINIAYSISCVIQFHIAPIAPKHFHPSLYSLNTPSIHHIGL